MTGCGMLDLACRRIALRPARWLLAGSALALLTLVAASVMLLLTGIERTASRVIGAGPGLVASRVDAGGWASIPARDAERVAALAGVEQVTPRVWGILPGPPAITLMADPKRDDGPPGATVGSTFAWAQVGSSLDLRGLDGALVELPVQGVLDPRADTVVRDVVLVPTTTARKLLLLGDGMATDLAIDTARDEENDALAREVAAVLGYPVRVTTRAQMLGAYRTQLSDRGGLGWMMLGPALLAVVLLILAAASGGPGARHDVGKLKLIGWSTGEVARLHVTQMGVVGFVGVGLGLIGAYVGVHVAGGTSILAPLLGFSEGPSQLVLDTEGAILVLVVVGACALLPCMIAALVPAFRLAREDPTNLLESS